MKQKSEGQSAVLFFIIIIYVGLQILKHLPEIIDYINNLPAR